MLSSLITYVRRHHIGLLALFVALGGSAYAASQVGTKGIKDESVRSVDLRDGAVRGADVKDGSIRAKDIADDFEEATASATLLADTQNGQGVGVRMLNNNGFSGFTHPEKGLYVLQLTDETDNGFCDVLATPLSPSGNAPAAALSVSPNTSSMFVSVARTNGEAANLGDSDFGYNAFSIRVYC